MELKEALARELLEIELMPSLLEGIVANIQVSGMEKGDAKAVTTRMMQTRGMQEMTEYLVGLYSEMSMETLKVILAFCKSKAADESKEVSRKTNEWMVLNGARIMNDVAAELIEDEY